MEASIYTLMRRLLTHGGKIVRASELGPHEREQAERAGMLVVDGEGNSFAWTPNAPKQTGWGGN